MSRRKRRRETEGEGRARDVDEATIKGRREWTLVRECKSIIEEGRRKRAVEGGEREENEKKKTAIN